MGDDYIAVTVAVIGRLIDNAVGGGAHRCFLAGRISTALCCMPNSCIGAVMEIALDARAEPPARSVKIAAFQP